MRSRNFERDSAEQMLAEWVSENWDNEMLSSHIHLHLEMTASLYIELVVAITENGFFSQMLTQLKEVLETNLQS